MLTLSSSFLHQKPFLLIITMAKTFLVASLLVSLLVLNLIQAHAEHVLSGSGTDTSVDGYGPPIDCGASCKARCQLSSRPNLCKRACGTCCSRCHCVPPGTSGNLESCPCYATMTTRGGKRKCP